MRAAAGLNGLDPTALGEPGPVTLWTNWAGSRDVGQLVRAAAAGEAALIGPGPWSAVPSIVGAFRAHQPRGRLGAVLLIDYRADARSSIEAARAAVQAFGHQPSLSDAEVRDMVVVSDQALGDRASAANRLGLAFVVITPIAGPDLVAAHRHAIGLATRLDEVFGPVRDRD
jgi:hypothetical protein